MVEDSKPTMDEVYQSGLKQALANGVDVDKLTELRRHIHQNAEGGFKEIMTSKLVRETLESFGLVKHAIKSTSTTGLIVDVKGTAAPAEGEEEKMYAFRADMDALPAPENNPELPYKSQT